MRSILLTLGLLAAAPAHALSCAFGPEVVLPGWEDEAVPTNAVFFVRSWAVPADSHRFFFVRPLDGTRIEATVTPLEDGDNEVVRITPVSPLDPDTAHELRVIEEGMDEAFGLEGDTGLVPGDTDAVEDLSWSMLEFTTGSGPDTTPPETPTLLKAGKQRGASPFFGSWENLRLLVDEPSEPVMYRLEIEDGDRTTVLYTGGWSMEDGRAEITVGQGPCGGEYDVTWSPVEVTVSAIDRAGQGSDGSSDPKRTGCHTAPTAPLALLSLAGLLAVRRRTR